MKFLLNEKKREEERWLRSWSMRRERDLKKFEMYWGVFKGEVEGLVRGQFSRENYEKLGPMIVSWDNLFRKMIDLKTVLYTKSPVREFFFKMEGDEGIFKEMVSEGEVEHGLSVVDQYANITGVGFIRIGVVRGKMELIPVPSYAVEVEESEENPFEMNLLVNEVGLKGGVKGVGGRKVFVWTNGKSSLDREGVGQYRVYNLEEGVRLDFKRAKAKVSIENPYKWYEGDLKRYEIPYVAFRVQKGMSFWERGFNEELYEGTLQMNVHLTHLNSLLRLGGYRQMILTGDLSEDIEEKLRQFSTDALSVLVARGGGENGRIGVHGYTFTEELSRYVEVLNTLRRRIADNGGAILGSEGSGGRGVRQSAEAMMLQRFALDEIRQKVVPLYKSSEKKLFSLMALVGSVAKEAGLGRKLSPFKMTTQWGELKSFLTQREQDAHEGMLLEQNRLSIVDLVGRENPGVGRGMIKERLLRNQEENEQVKRNILS